MEGGRWREREREGREEDRAFLLFEDLTELDDPSSCVSAI